MDSPGMDSPTPAPRRLYFNRAQLEAMVVAARNEYIVGGRGLGKSEGFDARVLLRNAFAMPGSAGALLSPSYTKLKTLTFPAIAAALARWGYQQGRHYTVGVRPPRELRYKSPIIAPFEWRNVICFYNGSIVHLVSFDRPMSTNSLSLDYLIGPEAKFLNHEKIVGEVLPAVRGNRQHFGHCPWHGGVYFSTDMPSTAQGRWILEKEAEMDPALIELIKRIYLERQALLQHPTAANLKRAATLAGHLQAARARATFFATYSTLENLEVLGEEWFHDQARRMPRKAFRTAILNQRTQEVESPYYAALDLEAHTYEPPTTPWAEQARWEPAPEPDCRWDADLLEDAPLMVALDYNAGINTLVVGQVAGQELRTLNAFYVKAPSTLRDVVAAFARYYAPRAHRGVWYFYDSTAVARTAATPECFADVVINTLQAAGFLVMPLYMGRPKRHNIKYIYINDALRGQGAYLRPTFNRVRCATLLAAMQRAGTDYGSGGFAKDKREEKKPETAESPAELRTHITDAWDTLFLGAHQTRNTQYGTVSEFR